MNVIEAQIKIRKLKWDAVAAQLVASDASLPKARILANYVRGLATGDEQRIVWWRKRPEAVKLLAHVLGLSHGEVDAVVQGTSTARPNGPFRPISSADLEHTFRLGLGVRETKKAQFDFERPRQETLNLFASTDPRAIWVQVPAGWGKSLAVKYRRNVAKTAALSVRSLTELEDQPDLLSSEEHLFVELEEHHPDRDWPVLRRLGERGHVLIAAAFPRPSLGPALGDPSPEESSAPPDAFVSFDWRPEAEWKEVLVDWLATRAPSFRSHEAMRFLREVEAATRPVESPEDLIALCELFLVDATAGRKLRNGEWGGLARAWIGSRTTAPNGDAFATQAPDLLRHLVGRALHDLSGPWGGGTTADELRARLGELPAVGGVFADLHRVGQRVRAASTAKKRDQLADELEAGTGLGSEQVFRSIREVGLLALAQDGEWALRPSWLVTGLALVEVERLVANEESAETWGRLAVDPTRRPFVASSLRRLAEGTLLRVLRAVLAKDAATLGVAGASELLFVEIGRRFLAGWDPAPSALPFLRALAQRQLDLMVDRFTSSPPTPLTLPGLGESSDGRHELVARCWAWSFAVPAPDRLRPNVDWLFPGWTTPRVDDPSAHQVLSANPRVRGEAEASRRPDEPGVEELLSMAPKVLGRLAPGTLPKDLLAPAGWVAAARRGDWDRAKRIEVTWPWHLAHLVELLDREDAALQRQAASVLFRQFTGPHSFDGAGLPVHLSHSRLPGVFARWVLERVALDEFRARALEVKTTYFAGSFAAALDNLPKEFRVPFIQAMHENGSLESHVHEQEIATLGRQHIDVLEALMRAGRPLNWIAARRRAEVDPDHALEAAKRAVGDGVPSEQALELLWNVANFCRSGVLEFVRELGAPDWAERWLIKILHEGRRDADEAFEMLQVIRLRRVKGAER